MGRVVCLAAIAAVGVVGCGGGSDEPETDEPADFIAELDQACAETYDQFEEAAEAAGLERGDAPQNQEEALAFAEAQLDSGQALQDRLGDLEPPSEDAETFDEYVSARQEVVQSREEAVAAAEEDDQDAYGASQAAADSAAIEAERIAAELGTTECAAGPSGSSELAMGFDEASGDLFQELTQADQQVQAELEGGDLAALQSAVASVRDAIFDFDADVRELEFPAELQPDVNALLTQSGEAIASLDEVGQAQDFDEARTLVESTFEEVTALNDATAELSTALAESEE